MFCTATTAPTSSLGATATTNWKQDRETIGLKGATGTTALQDIAGTMFYSVATATTFLLGGNDADVINGGGGVDTASYRHSGEGVTINLVTGRGSGGQAQGDRLTSIEGVIGSSHNDVLIVGNTSFNSFNGLGGTDTIRISGSGVSA